MKPIIIFLLLCISTTLFSQKISGKITYVVSMEPISEKIIDSVSKKNILKKTRMDKWVQNILKNTPNVNAFLSFSKEESLYKVEDEMQNDGKSIFNMNRIFAGGDNKYYKNTATKEQFRESSTFGDLLLIEMLPKKWQITQETKKIGNYVCFKAIDIESKNTKMKPLVWFTPEIPVSFGPKEFSGLPGLVLLVEMHKRRIEATKIILNPAEEIEITKPEKGKKITAEEIEKRGKSFWKRTRKQ